MTRPEGGRSAALPLTLWSLLLLAVTADVLLGGPLRHLDHTVTEWLSLHWDVGAAQRGGDHVWQETFLLALTDFGSPVGLPIAAGLFTLYLAVRHGTVRPPARLAVAGVLAIVLVYGVKNLVGRTQPLQDTLWTDAGHSYPSGHTATSVLVWGVVAWLAADYGAPRLLVAVTGVLRWLGPVITAVSMVMLIYHWVTDVLAGAATGVLLFALARTIDRAALAHLPRADRGLSAGAGVDRRVALRAADRR